MSSTKFIWVLLLFIACKEKDNYINLPDETDGLVMMYLDSGLSMKSVVQKDTLRHFESSDLCMKFKSDNIQKYQVYLIKYQGIQLVNDKKTIFYTVPGAMYINSVHNDSNIRIVNSHIGTAVLNVSDPENIYAVSFVFIPPDDIPRIDKCLYEKVLKPASVFSRKYYIECPGKSSGIAYGWKIGNIKNPKCYAYD